MDGGGGEDGIDPACGEAMDLDMALDLNFSHGAARPAPRSARFQPKMKGKVKNEPPIRIKPDPDTKPSSHPASCPDPVKEEPGVDPSSSRPDAEDAESGAMDVDGGFEEEVEEDDTVVREIDVFCSPTPLDEDTYLYILQYVLRPSWRPYELNERCDKVRVKPKKSNIEIDLSLDIDSENYDQDTSELQRLEKQTLSSSKTPLVATYAVGMLNGNQLHLNPVHAVVQLRPSIAYLNPKTKQNVQSAESSAKSDINAVGLPIKQEKLGQAGSNDGGEIDEPWISLEYHPIDSHFTDRYHQKMIAEDHHQIPFMIKPSDYINSLYPGTSTDDKRTQAFSLRHLLSLPLEKRLKKWFSEVCQVNNFNALLDLAPDSSKEDVLKVLPHYADLVQGLWVTKSSLLHEGEAALYRDYLLYLFSMNPIIQTDRLRMLTSKCTGLKSILIPLAVERRILKHWKFIKSTDMVFIRNNPKIVDDQEKAWLACWNNIKKSVGEKMHVPVPSGKRVKIADDVHESKDKAVNTAVSSLSSETQEHLLKILQKFFKDKKIRSINSVVNELRGLAISNSSRPREDPKIRAIINAAANGASAPISELQSIVSQIAVDVHGTYVLKSTGSSDLDRLRDVVIDLFRGKEPKAKLNKQEVRMAAKARLQKDINDSDYNQVMRDLCDSSKGSWALKSGD
ncbi:DNA-directed RNA polymerase III subunit RPC5-like [Zingiber officinale]|uniref:DNA-directed RNA polymerase III subunit RPC5-like n=1 Tax=Zingiber officinale TaxID=94328 RepID=UPI001C4B91A7|nr:DNA-directed RNA polymerase III subunit RPC5-like [Zingiber officinale]